jgi:pimeloyl-ACP methyl ester carboxylesterase
MLSLLCALLAAFMADDCESVPRADEQGFVEMRCDSPGRLYYEVRGWGEPLVLIHGGNLDHRMWAAQVETFAKMYRVVVYDVRGFGQSSEKDVRHQAHKDLLALLDRLKIEKAHLIGLSLGGRIAVDFAITHPDCVRSLILAGPGLSGWPWEPADWARVMAAVTRLPDKEIVKTALVEAWLASPYMAPAMERPELQGKLREWSRSNARVFLREGEETDQPLCPPATLRASEIRVPTLIMVGTRDVRDIKRIVRFLRRCIPNSDVIKFSGVGHMINLEDPERFNREVLSFLDRVRRRTKSW